MSAPPLSKEYLSGQKRLDRLRQRAPGSIERLKEHDSLSQIGQNGCCLRPTRPHNNHFASVRQSKLDPIYVARKRTECTVAKSDPAQLRSRGAPRGLAK
jgi:hypothetical protein